MMGVNSHDWLMQTFNDARIHSWLSERMKQLPCSNQRCSFERHMARILECLHE